MNLNTTSSLRFPEPPNPHVVGNEPVAAVALILVNKALFMIRRAEKEGDPWSGHMAFPGGRHEARDVSLKATAERETSEEVGIDLCNAKYLGPLTPLNHPRLTVYAYVYQFEEIPDVALNEEVAECYWFSFDDLLSAENRKPHTFHYKSKSMTFPSIQTQNVTIWGISFQFLSDLLNRLKE